MSKAVVTRLFIGAILAVVAGVVVGFVALVAALAGGAISIGTPDAVSVHAVPFARVFVWFVVASLLIAGAALAALASWIGALLNTWQLEDKTWFAALLVLGLISLGWVAMIAYVIWGPDATSPGTERSRVATTPGT
jgi:hypothetical protein